jgi:Cys-tRNA(Pro) deacylase
MSRDKAPVTPAVRALRAAGIAFTDHLYAYEEHGGTAVSARELGVDEHAVVKTLVMENERREPLIVLMHGDMQVSTQRLARELGVKSILPCAPETAARHTGYLVGGTSPFGTRRRLPVFMERSILELPRVYINGGKRGYLVGLEPRALLDVLQARLVEAGVAKGE